MMDESCIGCGTTLTSHHDLWAPPSTNKCKEIICFIFISDRYIGVQENSVQRTQLVKIKKFSEKVPLMKESDGFFWVDTQSTRELGLSFWCRIIDGCPL